MDSIPQKQCARCKELFPATLEYFRSDKAAYQGLSCYCLPCARIRDNERYKRRKQNSDQLADMQRRGLDAYYRVKADPDRYQHRNDVANKRRRERRATDPEYRARENSRARHSYSIMSLNPEWLARQRVLASESRARMRQNPEWVQRQNEAVRRHRKKIGTTVTSRQHLDYYHTPRGKQVILDVNRRRNSRKRDVPDTLTDAQWEQCVEFFGYCCAVCNRPLNGLFHKASKEHWQPISKGGGTTVHNIVPTCNGIGGCNNSKKDHDPTIWLTRKYGNKRAHEILARIEAYFDSVK